MFCYASLLFTTFHYLFLQESGKQLVKHSKQNKHKKTVKIRRKTTKRNKQHEKQSVTINNKH